MIEERASVVAVEGDFAWVEAERASGCSGCASRGSCGTSALAGAMGRRRARVKALNRVGAQPGERVVIGLQELALVRGTLAVYLVPLAGLFAGGLAGEVISRLPGSAGSGELAAVLGAGLGLWAGLAWARGWMRRRAGDAGMLPVILRRA